MGNLLGCSDSYDIDRQELENIIELKTNLEGKEKELEAELTKSAKKIKQIRKQQVELIRSRNDVEVGAMDLDSSGKSDQQETSKPTISVIAGKVQYRGLNDVVFRDEAVPESPVKKVTIPTFNNAGDFSNFVPVDAT